MRSSILAGAFALSLVRQVAAQASDSDKPTAVPAQSSQFVIPTAMFPMLNGTVTALGAASTGTGVSEPQSFITSTFLTSEVITITSCAPTVLDCPAATSPIITTSTYTATTIFCPADTPTPDAAPVPLGPSDAPGAPDAGSSAGVGGPGSDAGSGNVGGGDVSGGDVSGGDVSGGDVGSGGASGTTTTGTAADDCPPPVTVMVTATVTVCGSGCAATTPTDMPGGTAPQGGNDATGGASGSTGSPGSSDIAGTFDTYSNANQPDQPGQPGQIDQSVQFDRPGQSDQSGPSDKPGLSSQSSSPVQPGSSDQSVDSNQPDQPGQPGQPNQADRFGLSYAPESAPQPDSNLDQPCTTITQIFVRPLTTLTFGDMTTTPCTTITQTLTIPLTTFTFAVGGQTSTIATFIDPAATLMNVGTIGAARPTSAVIADPIAVSTSAFITTIGSPVNAISRSTTLLSAITRTILSSAPTGSSTLQATITARSSVASSSGASVSASISRNTIFSSSFGSASASIAGVAISVASLRSGVTVQPAITPRSTTGAAIPTTTLLSPSTSLPMPSSSPLPTIPTRTVVSLSARTFQA